MRPIPRSATPPDRPRRSRTRARTHRRETRPGQPEPRPEPHRVDIVGIDACLDCEQLVALTIPAGISELRQFGTTRRLRHLVFEVTAAGAGFADDILNQQ